MRNDKTTLKDLSVFAADGSAGIFELIDRTATQAGSDMLRRFIAQLPETREGLIAVQDAVKFWIAHPDLWPDNILNGTLVMLEKYFESADTASAPPAGFSLLLSSFFQKLLNRQEYFFTQFSLSHLSDFLRGCEKLAAIGELSTASALIAHEANEIKSALNHPLSRQIMGVTKHTGYTELMRINFRSRREMKNTVYRLMTNYARMDAWRSMALATVEHNWIFPDLLPELPVHLATTGLYHPLLSEPVAYDITLTKGQNFLLLTGANMSGKTTFMRSIGVAALLAHVGMGVPAKQLQISFLHGIVTHMQVEDNILKGESYFFAEVQRMKLTAEKLLQPHPHLVLMDELFKGTNVHDAYECTKAVLDGLLHHSNHLMILSTHLYEVAQQFSSHTEMNFAFFVTQMTAEGYKFTYELKEGISNDRIGYLILEKEGVLAMLRRQ